MACVRLEIDDSTTSLTLKAILEKEGHEVGGHRPDVTILDNAERAVERAADMPTLLLATASQIARAIDAMDRGVVGYIFVPLQPREADMMVRRAVSTASGGEADPPKKPELRTLEEVEQIHIEGVLRACNNNQAKAARVLGIGRNTLWRKLKKRKAQG